MSNIKVNIHNEGKIPWLNIQGPRYNISISSPIYGMLRNDPRVIMYPAEDDPIMRDKLAEKERLAAIEEKVVVVDKVVVEEEIVLPKEEEVVEEVPTEIEEEFPQVQIIKDFKTTDDDLLIDEALNALPEEDEEEFGDEEFDDLPFENEIVKEVYTNEELLELTKENLKTILNDDRGHQPGTEFYGRYHDNHGVLVQKVLDSQE